MKAKNTVMALLAIGVLAAGGVGLYQWGLSRGAASAMMTSGDGASEMGEAMASAGPVLEDPSNWGIPEGEAATRRHIEAGLKEGDIDPMTGREILYYHDPMVPGKKFDAPARSPFMDMMLVPAYSGSEGADSGTISVSPRIQQNLGMRTAEVRTGQLQHEITAVGTVTWNERGQQLVQARATGFVERLHVRAELDTVTAGQPLLDIHVPDWVAVQEDYLAARRLQVPGLESLVSGARQRMRQAGMNEAQIALVERTGQVQARVTLTAPVSGVVTALMAREGSTVMPGSLLMRIDDLSSVWIQAQVPESQATQVMPGSAVRVQTPALPGEWFEGEVQALLPEVDPTTRTRTARMVMSNPEERLVPGMFVRMLLAAEQRRDALLVPTEALVRTGTRTLIMVIDGESFRPVEVEIGREHGGQSEVLAGLDPGQRVVVSGQFLIDSEASLKGVEARLSSGELPVAEASSRSYFTTAKVEAVVDDRVTLTHPEIPDLKWPGMTMDFTLAGPSSAPALASDIDIEFQLQQGAAPRIIRWSTLDGSRSGAVQ